MLPGMFERSRRELIGYFALGLAVLAACSDEADRPPAPPPCNDPACAASPVGSVSSGGGVPSGGGNGGEGGGTGMPGEGIVLAGNVQQVTQLDPPAAGNISGAVEVRAPSAAANVSWVSEETDVSGAYRLEDVERALTVWVGVGAFEDPTADSFYMDTLQGVDPGETPDDLVIVPRNTLLDLAAQAFLNDPVELDPTAAHVFVRFVDPDGISLSDVAIINPPVLPQQPTRIAYDVGIGAYSDTVETTDVRGAAVIVNYPTVPYPGVTLELVATLNDLEYSVDVQVAANSVTVVTAVITER
jgi:hypothetical protein